MTAPALSLATLDTPRPSTAPQTAPPTVAAPRPGDALWAMRLALLLSAEAALRGPDTTPTPPAEVRPLRLVPEPRGQT
jgi:hypothetical protein